jgi:hypothetical protein
MDLEAYLGICAVRVYAKKINVVGQQFTMVSELWAGASSRGTVVMCRNLPNRINYREISKVAI